MIRTNVLLILALKLLVVATKTLLAQKSLVRFPVVALLQVALILLKSVMIQTPVPQIHAM
jgi:hypothetical protein